MVMSAIVGLAISYNNTGYSSYRNEFYSNGEE
jgi:hypothetical protein